MPGYNHYPDCTCGWCFKGGVTSYPQSIAIADADKSFAMHTLRGYGADRGWTSCFVIPNAICPVCGAKVYYYQNEYGSRVYFDELGWPWPKHPCTDNASASGIRSAAPKPIEPRKRGVVGNISEAASAAGYDPGAIFRSRYGYSPFDLLIVREIRRAGFENLIKADSIFPLLEKPLFLAFTSAKMVPLVGDFFSFNEGRVWFLKPETLSPQE